MLAFFYKNFSKRKKSTKIPDEEVQYDTKELVLKENTSEEKPVFIVTGNIETTYNYILWNRNYYFIDDIVSINNSMVEVHCTKDYLATWKPYIQNFQAFVERSESAFDPMLEDNMISQNHNTYIAKSVVPIDSYNSTGCYILRTMSTYGIRTYALQEQSGVQSVKELFRLLFGTQPNNPIQKIVDNFGTIISNALYNPAEHIISLTWVPISIWTFIERGVSTSPAVGWTAFESIQAYDITGMSFKGDFVEIANPNSLYTDFRRYSNAWSKYNLYIPAVGNVPIDASVTKNKLLISTVIEFDMCLITTYLAEQIGDSANIIGSYQSAFGATLPLSQMTGNNIVGTLASTVGAVATSYFAGQEMFDVVGSGVGALSTGIMNGVNDIPSMRGSSSSKSDWLLHPNYELSVMTFETKDDPVFIYGRPTMQYQTLGNLTGFIKTMNAEVDFPCHGDEKNILNSLLNSGFYFE